MAIMSQFLDMASLPYVSLVNFGYWSKFYVNIITSSRVMTIFFYKGLNRNQEIQNFPVWVLPNILRVGWVRGVKFGTNVSNKMLLNVAKCQCYSFYRFWVIKGKPTKRGGGKFILPPPTQIRVKAGRLTQKIINSAAFTRNRLCHKKQDGSRQ